MLHVFSPSHFTTSTSLFGLMRLAIHQLHQEEPRVLVLGTGDDATWCRNQGVPVLGSLSGSLDASKTLNKRLLRFLKETQQLRPEKILAWGWQAMRSTEKCSQEYDVYAMIDEIDLWAPCASEHIVIPTTMCAVAVAIEAGVRPSQLTEPLIGVEPSAVVANRATVQEALGLSGEEFLISIVGDVGSWQNIIDMAVRLNTILPSVHFVLPPRYRDRAILMNAAKTHGLRSKFHDVPPSIRQVDVVHIAHCAWCPSIAQFDRSTNVLDVLSAACVETPLAVSKNHPASTISTVGPHIAWVADDIEVSGWMLNLESSTSSSQIECADRVATVRSLVTPSRFIESLQMRLHALV